MEKIKPNSFLLFWSLLGFVALLIIWFLPWRFQVNDDEIMMWLVSGAYTGTPESYAVFIHPILSWTFSILYTFAPTVPWYPFTWFLVIYLGYLVLLMQIVKIDKAFWTKLVWTLFLFGLLVHFLFFLQFTIVAAFSITAGLASRLIPPKKAGSLKWFAVYPADILILLGILIRHEVPILLFAGVIFLNSLVIREQRIYKLLLIPILFFVVISSVSHFMIDQEFQKVNQLRSQVFDHPVLQLHKIDFQESQLELYHFSNGLIDFKNDPELSGKLETWNNFLDDERSRQFTLGGIITALYTYIEHEVFLISIMLLFIAYTLSWRDKSQLVFIFSLVMILILLSPFYLIKVQIYVMVFLLYLLASLIQSHSYLGNDAISKGVAIILIAGICFHLYSFSKSHKNFPSTQTLETQIRKLNDEGINEVILIAAGEVYHELTFNNPLPFKVLGWPTLLKSVETNDLKRAYLVDSATYSSNATYFKDIEQQSSMCDQVLLISKE